MLNSSTLVDEDVVFSSEMHTVAYCELPFWGEVMQPLPRGTWDIQHDRI